MSQTRLQKKPTSAPLAAPPPAVGPAKRDGGQALDRRTSAEMSARFGHDFSQVRIHTDARAEESADALGAHAYAHGSDIVFGAGRYTPGSPDTERLLAHELTHVAQQARFGPASDPSGLSRRGDASEREADSLASQVVMGRSVQVGAAPTAAVHRYQAPDAEWTNKRNADAGSRDANVLEAIPGFGNFFSAGAGVMDLGAAGYDALTGDKAAANDRLKGAEDFGLNAIPWIGNYRAAKHASYDDDAVKRDDQGIIPPVSNPNSVDVWHKPGGGADSLNGGISQVWDSLWG